MLKINTFTKNDFEKVLLHRKSNDVAYFLSEIMDETAMNSEVDGDEDADDNLPSGDLSNLTSANRMEYGWSNRHQ